MSKDKIIDINGLTIKMDSVYKVTPKPDSAAPDGFVKEGTTKLPSLGIYNGIPCRFITTNSATKEGVYDTGFYEQSPCYATLKKEEKIARIKVLKEKIVEPYEAKYGLGTLDHDNTDFWDSFNVHLEAGKPYVTSNPDDLLALYIAIMTFELTPKAKLGDPKFKKSQFCIEDNDKVKSRKDEIASLRMDSTINFGILLKTDKSLLLNVLKYIQMIDFNQEYETETLKATFYTWINSNDDNPIKFMKAFKFTEDDKTVEEINLYSVVIGLYKKGVIKHTGNEYSFQDTILGADFKTIAHNLSTNKELENIKIALLES